MKYLLLLACMLVSGVVTAAPKDDRANIRLLIQARKGPASCRGVIIELKRGSFYPRIARHEISIVERKHGRELKSRMAWKVSRSGRVLTIWFRSGSYSFESGDEVKVAIKSSALMGIPQPPIQLSISTDVP